MAAALTYKSKFGFAFQSAKGTQSSSAPIWLPFAGDMSFTRGVSAETLELADNCNFDRLMFPKYKIWQGSVTLFLCPGSTTSLMQWILTRDADNQGKWASVWVVDGLGTVPRIAIDVKVASASFNFSSQGPVTVSLDLVGIGDGVYDSENPPSGLTDRVLVAPYISKDVVLGHQVVSGDSDTGYNCKSVSFSIDNALDSPEEGLRLNGSYFPFTLYNNSYYRISGSIERDFQSYDMENAFTLQHEDSINAPTYDWNETTYNGWLRIALSRGVNSLTFDMKSIRYTDWSPRIAGSRTGVQTEVSNFIGLTYYDSGADPPAWVDPLVVT